MRDRLGVCQWFHYQAYEDVERAVELLRELGVRHLRTGISWADFLRPGGKRWYDWQMAALGEFDVLLSVWHTPPSLAEGGTCASPPRRLRDYADFLDLVLTEYGSRIDAIELWNEPNNRLKWDFPLFDPEWRKFAEMIGMAAHWVRRRRKRTVLGGMIPVDPEWLALIERHGGLADVDTVAIHGFPGMWWSEAPNWDWYDRWRGWADKVESIAAVDGGRPIWITETGLATWDLPNRRPGLWQAQAERLREAAAAPAERVYWYSLRDLDPSREAIEGFHVDENEYHLGLVTASLEKKPAWHAMRELLREHS